MVTASRTAALALFALAVGCDAVAGLSEFHPAEGGGGALPTGGAPAAGAPEGGAPEAGAPPTGGAGGGCATNLLITEIRTTGEGAGDDDFVEIYNPTAEDIELGDVSIWGYKPENPPASPRWSGGAAEHLPPGARFVVGGMGFDPRLRDAQFSASIGDTQIVLLRRGPGGVPPVIDQVCICTNNCGESALWGGCPGVLKNPAWVNNAITATPDSLSRVPDCVDSDTDIDFSDGAATPGEANDP